MINRKIFSKPIKVCRSKSPLIYKSHS